jgi:hypothetical protein
MKYLYYFLISILLTMLSFLPTHALLDINIKLDGMWQWLAKIIEDWANTLKNIWTSAFSLSDYAKITNQIRDDFTLFSEYTRNAKTLYKQIKSETDAKPFRYKIYNVSYGYCQIRWKQETALWNAYMKDRQSRFPKWFEKPWITFMWANCKAYWTKILKYVIWVK